jgi:DNA-binding NarL/FixJ family response regulator
VALSTSQTQSLTCIVADDHPAFVDSVSLLLGGTAGIEVVGAAADGLQAVARVLELDPDVAIIDAEMPDLDGIEVMRRLVGHGARSAVVVYSERADATFAHQLLGAGAKGLVLKAGPLADLVRAVQTVGAGGTFVDPGLTPEGTGGAAGISLTQREREVLELLADGMRTEEAADRLSISSLTVSTHVKHAMEKLDASSRSEAVATALRVSLIA